MTPCLFMIPGADLSSREVSNAVRLQLSDAPVTIFIAFHHFGNWLRASFFLGLFRSWFILFFLFSCMSHLIVLIYSFAPTQGPHRVSRELMLQYSDNQTIFHSPWWCRASTSSS